MKLKTVLVRFYKSFNFDYLRKFHSNAKHNEWERIDELWYPFVKVPIESQITTIVGANESGKSHLLSSIEKGITGNEIQREDFCRYSQFYTVEKGKRKFPDFGFEWVDLSSEEKQIFKQSCNIPDTLSFDRLFLFRIDQNKLDVYLPENENFHKYSVNSDSIPNVNKILPQIFRIDPDIALPDSVPIKNLIKGVLQEEEIDRRNRFAIFESGNLHPEWFQNQQLVSQHAVEISAQYLNLTKQQSQTGKDRKIKEFNLACDLLFKVAKIDQAAIEDLYTALKQGKEGHVNGIIQRINDLLATNMNFPHWWAQDRNFQLVTSAREFDLVFTIRDKTKTEYSFKERSSGLKFFLSYYTQYRAHIPPSDREEILLMDEPDAYLSSQAQQDLLKVFDGFANPTDSKKSIQVIYVTHSPFLIDKNHAERIRVLEKGIEDEGTRVVQDAARNHYEPLRSALGAFVGETAFIGNSNLIVEGSSDQILLAGVAVHLKKQNVSNLETLDLNNITLVPAGSASSIPYLIYLARGRDVEKPPIIVLMDSDEAGNAARKQIAKGGAYGKRLISDHLILQVGEIQDESKKEKIVSIEDFIPITVCVVAAKYFLRNICGASGEDLVNLTTQLLESKLEVSGTMFDAVANCVTEISNEEFHIDKIGFARCVVDVLDNKGKKDELIGSCDPSAVKEFEERMKILFRRLDKMRRTAEREINIERISHKIQRLKKAFVQDCPNGATKERVYILFDEITSMLGDDYESEEVRLSLSKLRREFELDKNLTELVSDYSHFLEMLETVRYAARLAIQDGTFGEASHKAEKELIEQKIK